MGFSIASPGFKDFERKLAKVDLGKVAYDAAEALAHERLIDDLTAAARTAGASPQMRDDIAFYQEDGDVRVGVPGPAAQEAFDLEYGTAAAAPAGWLRSTFAQHQSDYDQEFGAQLSRRLAEGWA